MIRFAAGVASAAMMIFGSIIVIQHSHMGGLLLRFMQV
ncbi:YbfB/YjiJ family MFS transporter [Bartonella sp. CL100XZDX]